uniref:Uncharacterized protein n=1 Tax=viral metagenome TaxID=1070528 RepID=A0A6C0D5K3_9ZZZZ
MDTKGTKELIKALNPDSELRAIIQQEKSFIETSKLAQSESKQKAFRRGIKTLKNATRKGLRRTRKAIGSLFQKPFPKTKRVRRSNPITPSI